MCDTRADPRDIVLIGLQRNRHCCDECVRVNVDRIIVKDVSLCDAAQNAVRGRQVEQKDSSVS